jgi:hypothetical protein
MAGGPFLPLAGGTMDAFPNGIINAHTIIGPTGGTLSLNSLNSGTTGNVNITSNNTNIKVGDPIDSITMNANTKLDIYSPAIIQPPTGYTYPNNPSIALDIKNWFNSINGFTNIGLKLSGFQNQGAIDVIQIGGITGGLGLATNGINILNLDSSSLGETCAFRAGGAFPNNILGFDNSYGVNLTNIRKNGTGIGECVAFKATEIISNLANSLGVASGLLITDIQAVQGVAQGIYIKDVSSTGKKAYGAFFDNIQSFGDEALGLKLKSINGKLDTYGINIETVNSSNQNAYGIYITGVTSVVGGTQAYGIFQNGLISGGNVLQSKLECGASETTSQPLPSLNVIGTVQSSVQLTGPISPYTISNNAGNTVISDDAANTVINLPAIPYFGAEYTIWKTHGGSVAITPAPGQPINGGTGFFAFLGAAYKTATIVWSGTEWLAHLN